MLKAKSIMKDKASGIVAGAMACVLAITMCPLAGVQEARATTYDDGNITVAMPTTINYVARADGSLIAPSSSVLTLANLSNWEVRVSSVKVTPAEGWGIATNADAAAAADPNGNNYISLTMGPEDDQLDLADYVSASTPLPVNNDIAWTMAMPAQNEDLSSIEMLTVGHVADVDALTAQSETVATTEWYLAADTTTDEVYTRIADLEAENAALQQALSDLEDDYDTLSGTVTTLGESVSRLNIGNNVLALTYGTDFINMEADFVNGKRLAFKLHTDAGLLNAAYYNGSSWQGEKTIATF